jgi:hypothetical protein
LVVRVFMPNFGDKRKKLNLYEYEKDYDDSMPDDADNEHMGWRV